MQHKKMPPAGLPTMAIALFNAQLVTEDDLIAVIKEKKVALSATQEQMEEIPIPPTNT